MSKILPDFYTVEKILNKRIINGKTQYFVKWEGYSEADNTWEPLVNLESVMYLVTEFDKAYSKKSAKIEEVYQDQDNTLCMYTYNYLLCSK